MKILIKKLLIFKNYINENKFNWIFIVIVCYFYKY